LLELSGLDNLHLNLLVCLALGYHLSDPQAMKFITVTKHYISSIYSLSSWTLVVQVSQSSDNTSRCYNGLWSLLY